MKKREDNKWKHTSSCVVRIDLSARRICRLDVVDFVVFPDDDESDLGRETDNVDNAGESTAAVADAAATMSATPLTCFKKSREGEIVRWLLSIRMQLGILERSFLTFF